MMPQANIVFLIGLLVLQHCTNPADKINGISLVSADMALHNNHIEPVLQVNANFAAVMPFGFIRDLDHPEIVYNTERQWYGETKTGVTQYINTLKTNRIKIMLKPQIWVWHGKFTGDIHMQSESDWQLLEASYSKFILDYAQLAQHLKVELFCIGTELENFIKMRPSYWFLLIQEIKKAYTGKLTYAANWNEFGQTPFWSVLDYIGIDAYFPISASKTPSVQECMEGWETHKAAIESVFVTTGKPILFTEYGYRSMDYSGREPWKSDEVFAPVNLEAQHNTTQALYNTFWDEYWFAGGFIWKWFVNHDASGGSNNNRFTPQNKPVEALMKTQYD
ncbi:glycoside hydrolase family 113 [Aestuariivivens sediminis]|uniref:glycoside hydrolase family 113 n=1 Tax=Aestuariivivens sediminis TaxID=2913557 RepID=UPI001F560458|nr:glycoside hydrolase [Aestuariivivens sediminis]